MHTCCAETGGAVGCEPVIPGLCAPIYKKINVEPCAEPAVTAVRACTAEFSIFTWDLTWKLYRYANCIRGL